MADSAELAERSEPALRWQRRWPSGTMGALGVDEMVAMRMMVVVAVALSLVVTGCGSTDAESAGNTAEVTGEVESSGFCEEWSRFLSFVEERQGDPPPETLTDLQAVHDQWRTLLDDAAEAAPRELDVPMETMQRLVDEMAEREGKKFRSGEAISEDSLSSAVGMLAEVMASRGNIDEYYETNC